MADDACRFTYDDGYVLLNMISGDVHYAKLQDHEVIEEMFATQKYPILTFVDVFGSRVALRVDRVESIEEQTPAALEEIERVNAYAEGVRKAAKPSWMD